MKKFEIRIQELHELLPIFMRENLSDLNSITEVICEAFTNGNKILICGNGGSAADAQHIAAEFVNRFASDLNRKALPAISLSADSSVITSIANDFSFESVFSRQIMAMGNHGDILIILSTSGESKNCLNAALTSRELGLKTIAFTNQSSSLTELADYSIKVPSTNTQHIQECHLVAYHVLVELVEDKLYRGSNG